ncbi:hypothetical protein ASC80_13590 [Afipia sp. Root123D2]|uniref:ChbG/HpnK family deacetylase n=1 Tax=Afipia sp. Root123D2 TaxID=1736436 RepID=UPI0006F8B4A6|nr:ChbG/HpnK family deacetylase [Afipia sp. Root123D2]KQW21152.1 hypothetical protein ASC80_13590 [Afipia sp. Root123D2]
MNDAPLRRIVLCADDYGISPGVNRAIRDLIERRRINATSVMMLGPALDRTEIGALQQAVKANPDCAIGLHTTLTAPFTPLTLHFRPLDGGMFLPLGAMLLAALLRRLDREMIHSEIAAQIAAFTERFGRPPDYADGHQHVQIFPQVRDAFLDAIKTAAPDAWVRQCGRDAPLGKRLNNPKALLLDTLSATFRKLSAGSGVASNPAFAGAYDFTRQNDFAALMAQFIRDLPERGLVMCHPGFVDDTLIALDPLTHQREREHAYLASDDFPHLLAAHRITL